MNQPDPEPELLNANEMARFLRVPLRWVKAEAEAGRIPCLPVEANGKYLFDRVAVERTLLERARGIENPRRSDPARAVD